MTVGRKDWTLIATLAYVAVVVILRRAGLIDPETTGYLLTAALAGIARVAGIAVEDAGAKAAGRGGPPGNRRAP